jgi:hypothetical protein
VASTPPQESRASARLATVRRRWALPAYRVGLIADRRRDANRQPQPARDAGFSRCRAARGDQLPARRRHGAIELAATCLVDKAVLIAAWMAQVLWSGTPVLSTVPVVWQHWRHGSGIVWTHAARETCLRRAEVSAQQLASASETSAAANTQ